jgi:hypothetical protein
MKPTTYYPWAQLDGETEDIDELGYTGSVPNKSPPELQFEIRGIYYGEPMPYQYWNYQNDAPGKWAAHLDQRYSMGDLHPTTEDLTILQVSAQLGGTWVLQGTTTISSTTTYWWRKLF